MTVAGARQTAADMAVKLHIEQATHRVKALGLPDEIARYLHQDLAQACSVFLPLGVDGRTARLARAVNAEWARQRPGVKADSRP